MLDIVRDAELELVVVQLLTLPSGDLLAVWKRIGEVLDHRHQPEFLQTYAEREG